MLPGRGHVGARGPALARRVEDVGRALGRVVVADPAEEVDPALVAHRPRPAALLRQVGSVQPPVRPGIVDPQALRRLEVALECFFFLRFAEAKTYLLPCIAR